MLTTTGAVYPEIVSSTRSVRNVFASYSSPGIRVEHGAQALEHALLARAVQRLERDLELAVMAAIRVGAPFGAAGPLRHGANALDREKLLADVRADADRFSERRAGQPGRMHDVVPLAQRREELRAEARKTQRDDRTRRDDDRDGNERVTADDREHPVVDRHEQCDERRIAFTDAPFRRASRRTARVSP